MDDKELLERAAKAAGIPGTYQRHWGDSGINNDDPDGGLWNPLESDSDALRLAVKLEIKVMPCQDDSCAKTGGSAWICVDNGSDPYAATRRAITRAAAALAE